MRNSSPTLLAAFLLGSSATSAQLTVGTLPSAVWCAGTTIDIPFDAPGAFNAGNTFIMEISGADGLFAPAMPIGSLAGTSSGVITCTNTSLTLGPGHLVRARSTDPPITSDPSATALTLAAPNAGADGMASICTNGAPVALLSYLTGASPGGVWTDVDGTGALVGPVLQLSLLGPGTYTFTYTVDEFGCTDSATLTVVANAAPNAGSNAAITVCSTDPPFAMYEQLAGSPVAGGAWTSPGGAQMNGMYDPSMDPPGLYLYTVAGEPPCANATSTLSITVVQSPDAGTDGSIEVCSSSAPFILVEHLGGTPAPGGSWSAPSPVVGGVYIPATMEPGVHTYTVAGVGPCMAATATVTVTEITAVDAGSEGFLLTCSSSPATSLLEALSGTPDAGGTWSGPSPVNNGSFDPPTMAPGVYTYTISATPPCSDESAEVTVVMNQAPNAGTDGAATYCTTDAAFPLVQHLGGTPSPSGTWTFGGSPHAPVFVPGTDGPGEYVYTVPGSAPCGSATATVTISEITCVVNTPVNLGIQNVTE